MKLSIIIPFYNREKYIGELLDVLDKQIVPEVEVILVDDGSKVPFKTDYSWCKVVRKENGGLASARNYGMRFAKGEYISFVDADDLVSENYVNLTLNKIVEEAFDYMDLSWKSLPGGVQYDFKLNSINDSLSNPSVCTRIFKRSFIGDLKFNEKKLAAEDEDFTRRLDFKGKKKAVATEYMYFYRTDVPDSLSKKYMDGSLGMKRIIYHFDKVTKNMTYLIDEFKKTYEESEIFLLTNKNEIPELEKYCSVWQPQPMRGMELRGEPLNGFTKIEMPITCQIAFYTSVTFLIGGIETFIYNFCQQMTDYSIVVVYDRMDEKQIERLRPYVKDIVKNAPEKKIICDTLIMNRVFDKIPACITYKQSVQMVHACEDCCDYDLPVDRDKMVFVSETAKKSWGDAYKDYPVINNIITKEPVKNPLLLITASRLDTHEKGQARMLKLAKLLNNAKIPFLWLYFSNARLNGCPENLIHMSPTLDVRGYIQKADYLVQLSDSESFCYSIAEALDLGIPVITTPLPVLSELGVNEKNSHIIPFEIPDDFDVSPIFWERKKSFRYSYDNKKLIAKWHDVLDNIPEKVYVQVEITVTYDDVVLGRRLEKGTVMEMEEKRAKLVASKGFCKIISARATENLTTIITD